jgi:hypothetical protein
MVELKLQVKMMKKLIISLIKTLHKQAIVNIQIFLNTKNHFLKKYFFFYS